MIEGTKITIKDKYGTKSVSVSNEDMTLDEFIRVLIIPALLSCEYGIELVTEYFTARGE